MWVGPDVPFECRKGWHRPCSGLQEVEEKRAEANIAHLMVQILLMALYELHSRSDGSVYQNDVMQFLRLRWGKVVEDHLYEDTYKLVNELQQRLSREETDRIERQTLMQESLLRETSKGESAR